MIPSGVELYVASTPVDFRKGPVSLMALLREGGVNPFNGSLYVFRSKRADRVKIVWWDGSGVCLTLEKAQFCWPRIAPARVRLMTWVMERTPCAFIKMPAEVLRDHYLGLLLGRAVVQQHGALDSDP